MYCHFYGLADSPFKPAPSPRYFYMSPEHREALANILYHIHGHYGIVAIEGEVGTGKTTVLKTARKMIERRASTAYIFNPHLSFPQILAMILFELKLLKRKERISKADAIDRLNRLAVGALARNSNVVIFIDEAHLLSAQAFENLRLLTNLESMDRKLIQIVLAGQPELMGKLQRPELRQFNQRISRMLSIGPLNENHTLRYIQHRMRIAGYSGPMVFESKALKLIWRYSRGIPRLINKLCDNALLLNYISGNQLVPAAVIREVAHNFNLNRPWLNWRLRQPVAPGWLRRDKPAA